MPGLLRFTARELGRHPPDASFQRWRIVKAHMPGAKGQLFSSLLPERNTYEIFMLCLVLLSPIQEMFYNFAPM